MNYTQNTVSMTTRSVCYFIVLWILLLNRCYGAISRPNFIFILSDDQDLTLESMQAMPNVLTFIANDGVTFNNSFVSTPICCPSRTETIAGRNFHNVKENGHNNCMHVAASYNVFNNPQSMFQTFQQNGYLTASFGKLTNDQTSFWCNNNPNLKGFDRVHCPCDFNNFYGLEYFDKFTNGTTHSYTLDLTANAYETAYVGNASIKFISERMIDQNTNPKTAKPFIMWIGPHAPHCPATPAAWYYDRFNTTRAPEGPNFNSSDSLKHGFVGTNPPMDDTAIQWIDDSYRDRLRSLLSIDDMVYDIFSLLQKYPDIMDNTYVLYTSDHGYHLGQYDVPCFKSQPYEETIRVPMYFRGPNIPKQQTKMEIVGNIDILPTFLDLAGINYDRNTYDGRSWLDMFNQSNINDNYNDVEWRTVFLTQYQSIDTLNFSHCKVWYPSNDGSLVPGQIVMPPDDNSNGKEWLVDDEQTNNWRVVRIINETTNWMYGEFIGPSWDNTSFNHPYCFEFYDIKQDPFQLKNSYSLLSKGVQNELHSMLMTYGECSGTSCW
eukprot:304657_1